MLPDFLKGNHFFNNLATLLWLWWPQDPGQGTRQVQVALSQVGKAHKGCFRGSPRARNSPRLSQGLGQSVQRQRAQFVNQGGATDAVQHQQAWRRRHRAYPRPGDCGAELQRQCSCWQGQRRQRRRRLHSKMAFSSAGGASASVVHAIPTGRKVPSSCAAGLLQDQLNGDSANVATSCFGRRSIDS
jgi:hypothetical protein